MDIKRFLYSNLAVTLIVQWRLFGYPCKSIIINSAYISLVGQLYICLIDQGVVQGSINLSMPE